MNNTQSSIRELSPSELDYVGGAGLVGEVGGLVENVVGQAGGLVENLAGAAGGLVENLAGGLLKAL